MLTAFAVSAIADRLIGPNAYRIEDLFVKVTVFILLLFATLTECSQNQTAVSDTLRLLSDF
jgi:hypothetical protein